MQGRRRDVVGSLLLFTLGPLALAETARAEASEDQVARCRRRRGEKVGLGVVLGATQILASDETVQAGRLKRWSGIGSSS